MTTRTLPTFYVSHGAGPWPWMEGQMRDAHDQLAVALRQIPQLVAATPKAVLMISAHWEEPDFSVMAHPCPPMLYDYQGFPEHTYHVQYAAPGAPQLADQVRGLLEDSRISVRLDLTRGFDHGTYVPMTLMYPEADVPTLQLSLKEGLDPKSHLAVGRALSTLRDDGVLIVGSGSSAHNVRLLGKPEGARAANSFDDWLQRTLVDAWSEKRSIALESWETAPAARLAHPREEHLLPLMVAVGAAEGDKGTCIYHEDMFFGTGALSNFMFGES
jgi:aromatic ring-opening dioxygenase catalytic subunit (LigB family)